MPEWRVVALRLLAARGRLTAREVAVGLGAPQNAARRVLTHPWFEVVPGSAPRAYRLSAEGRTRAEPASRRDPEESQ